MTFRAMAVVGALVVAIAGCAGKKAPVPADQLWTEGNASFEDEAYDYAIEKYKALLDQYPFDQHAEEAELKIAQAYYAAERYPEAIAAFSNFERMHPTSTFLPTTEYHRGLSYLAQYTTADRDQQAVTNALNTFRNIVDRFPGTPGRSVHSSASVNVARRSRVTRRRWLPTTSSRTACARPRRACADC
jgi:outer membrane protein assembly factor BamD